MKVLFDSIARLFAHRSDKIDALGALSEDPVALAQLLLLFRMVLADGVVSPSQLTAFERICEQHFGISRRDMPELHALLDSPKAESCDASAFTLIAQLDTEARRTLLEDMMRIARANINRDEHDDRLIRRTASLLGLDPGSIDIEEKGTGHE